MEICDGENIIYSLGSEGDSGKENALMAALAEFGGVGSIAVGNTSLYSENINVSGKEYIVYIFTDGQIKESEINELAVKNMGGKPVAQRSADSYDDP
ncbi:MAG: hypothetical protein SOT68_06040 [Oscillospiraceae bacterium]|nr:hypothetical protein [Oscillospiraceae bacterium]MCI7497985.1 hypothetical protein [Oscillospiraceae bacterium]MDD7278497.1 hypothetical protein [Oscillospiraceae bacterium]MDY2863743.1 hypothetical protein [Oscillospiraceae bacterium]